MLTVGLGSQNMDWAPSQAHILSVGLKMLKVGPKCWKLQQNPIGSNTTLLGRALVSKSKLYLRNLSY